MADLDLKDRKILYELDLNCRQSNTQIGKKVGLSRKVVEYRIKKMEEEGVIMGTGLQSILLNWVIKSSGFILNSKMLQRRRNGRLLITLRIIKTLGSLHPLKSQSILMLLFG